MIYEIIQSPAFWLCLVFAFTDAIRDKCNSAAYKYPNSGRQFKIARWEFRVDFWHIVKWIQIYSVGAYLLIDVPTVPGKIAAVIFAWALWRIVPKPMHWR